jgi:outer membrane lipoprotein-sorting protein
MRRRTLLLFVFAGLALGAAKPDPQSPPLPFSLDAPSGTPSAAVPAGSPAPGPAIAPGEVNRRADIRLLTQARDMAARLVMTMTSEGDVDRHVEVTLLRRGASAYAYLHQPEPMRGAVLSLFGDRLRLYHPDTDLTERLPAPDGEEPFFGSDLELSDVFGPPEKVACSAFPPEVVGGRACLVVECRPHDGGVRWSRRVTWVDQESFFPVRRIWYDGSGIAVRRLDVEKLQQVGRYWWAMHWTVKDPRGSHSTSVEFTEVRFDSGIPKSVFRDERYFRRPPESWVKP